MKSIDTNPYWSTDAQATRAILVDLNITIYGFHKKAWGTLIVFEDTKGNLQKAMQPR